MNYLAFLSTVNEETQTLAFQTLTVTTGARNLKQKSKYTIIMAKTAETQGPISSTSIHVIVGLAQWLASQTTDQGVPGSRPGQGTVCYGIEQVTFTNCLVLVKPRKLWTDD